MRMMRIPSAWLDWFDLRRAMVWLLVIGGAYAWLVHRVLTSGRSPMGVLALAPVVAFLLAPAFIQALVLGLRWMAERPRAPWQGRYYAFDDRQIRIVESSGRLWFSTADVHAALDLSLRAGVLAAFATSQRREVHEIGDALSNEGLERLLAGSTDRHVLRFLRWAEHDVRRPWQKKRDGLVDHVRQSSTASQATGIPRRDV